jgi:8-oxo-dGTP pyrophosphatase MutT (NUDIX family)
MLRVMPSLDEIRGALAAHEPATLVTDTARQAAVAVVLREAQGAPDVLLIERARQEGDPWSGHMAFPGGRLEPADAGPRAAAERETLEEVGVRLDRAEALGRLGDLRGHHVAGVRALVISAFVYFAPDPEPLVPNHEVRDAFWFSLPSLLDPERHVDYPLRHAGGDWYPGILVGVAGRQIVWGLTYRFLEIFFEIVGRPLPPRWRGDPDR